MLVIAFRYLWATRCASLIDGDANEEFLDHRVPVICVEFICGRTASRIARGQTVCSNGKTAVAVNPNTGNAAVAHKNPNGVTTTQTSNGGTVKSANGVAVAQGPNGAAVVNPHTGNAAVAQTNSNGVTTTQNQQRRHSQDQEWNGRSPRPGWHHLRQGTANNQGCTK